MELSKVIDWYISVLSNQHFFDVCSSTWMSRIDAQETEREDNLNPTEPKV